MPNCPEWDTTASYKTMYTKQSLIDENELYNHIHGVTDKDVNLANIYKLSIETSRSTIAPKPGDVLIKKDGKQYHIDEVENEYLKRGRLVIVENAYVPFTRLKIADDSVKISLATSGGPFSSIDCDNIEHTGLQESRTFGFFGSHGACANGQVQIKALVNIFKEI